MGTSCNQY